MTASSRPSTRTIVLLLTLALLLAQMLGLMHGTLHGPGVGAGVRAVSHTALQGSAPYSAADVQIVPQTAGKGLLSSLFSSHNSSADCRLFDQASHGSAALQVVSLPLPVVLPPFAVAIFQGEALARWAALFDARGPPLTS